MCQQLGQNLALVREIILAHAETPLQLRELPRLGKHILRPRPLTQEQRALDREIRAATHDGKSLDDLARSLSEAHAPVTNAGFRTAAAGLIGAAPKALAGCPR